jgi:peroxiredoxin
MTLIRILFLTLFAIFLSGEIAYCNDLGDSLTRPEIGKPIPDFTLNHVTHYKATKLSLSDLKGKWSILDFWSLSCLTCLESFPGVNAHYQEFKGELNWIMIGLNDSQRNKGIERFYEKVRLKQHLDLPVAYDSTLSIRWGVGALPHLFIIDPQGIVRFITTGHDLTRQKLRDLLDGKEISLYALNKIRETANRTRQEILSSKVLYTSSITRSVDEAASGGEEVDRWVAYPDKYKGRGYTFESVSLVWLYCHAFFGKAFWEYDDPLYGKIYPRPIVETGDSSLFGPGMRFSYSLALPISQITRENVMSAMQQDLERGFGFEAVVEKRPVHVWKLVAKPGVIQKLKTKGGPERYYTPEIPTLGFTIRNWPREFFLGWVANLLQPKFDKPYIPFIDKTGLNENFDLTLEADMMNLKDVQRALRQQGLDLVEGIEVMDALVIRNRKLP